MSPPKHTPQQRRPENEPGSPSSTIVPLPLTRVLDEPGAGDQALVAVGKSDAPGLEHDATTRAQRIVTAATSPATIRARTDAVNYFDAWHRGTFLERAMFPIPVALLLRFIVDHLEGLKHDVAELIEQRRFVQAGPDGRDRREPRRRHAVATIEARVAHLSKIHRLAGLASPADDVRVGETLRAAKKERARAGGQRRAGALTIEPLERLVATCYAETRIDVRDRALLLVGFAAGGRRRSELAGLMVEDLTGDGEDYTWTIRQSKTDQEGRDRLTVAIRGRAAAALREWQEAAGVALGPVFRSVSRWGHLGRSLDTSSIRRIVIKRAELAGLDTSKISAHSLRAGFMTAAGRAGVGIADSMAMSGHRSASVALGYHRSGDSKNNPAARLLDQ